MPTWCCTPLIDAITRRASPPDRQTAKCFPTPIPNTKVLAPSRCSKATIYQFARASFHYRQHRHHRAQPSSPNSPPTNPPPENASPNSWASSSTKSTSKAKTAESVVPSTKSSNNALPAIYMVTRTRKTDMLILNHRSWSSLSPATATVQLSIYGQPALQQAARIAHGRQRRSVHASLGELHQVERELVENKPMLTRKRRTALHPPANARTASIMIGLARLT